MQKLGNKVLKVILFVVLFSLFSIISYSETKSGKDYREEYKDKCSLLEKAADLPLKPHPRLLDNTTKNKLKEFISKHPEVKERLRGSLAYQLLNNYEQGRKVVEDAVNTAKKWNSNPPSPGTGFSHDSTAGQMAYVLDWCYDLIKPEEKEEIIRCGNDAAWGCLVGYEGSFRGGDALYNHFTCRLLSSLLWGISSYGEDKDAKIFLQNGYRTLKDKMVDEYKPWIVGGAMWEGGDYGWADFHHTLQMMLAIKSATTTGEDLTRVINLADRIPFFIHATRPTGDCYYFQGHAWSNNAISGTLNPRYRNLLIQFANAYPELGIYVPTYLKNTVLSQFEGEELNEMLLKINYPEPKDYETDFPPSYYASSLGVVLARSSWADPDATHISFICGPYIHRYSDQDQGHFEIFKRRRLVIDIGARDQYLDVSLPSWKHNTIVVGELGEQIGSGGQRESNRTVGAGGKIIALEDDYINYLHICGDLTNAYLSDRIENYIREIVFIRPDYVIVFDKVVTTNADWRKRFFLYLWNKPENEGEYIVMKNKPAKLLIKTLLPERSVVSVIGPGADGKGASAYTRKMGKSFHLEIEPEQKAKEAYFLHFFKATDLDVKEVPKCELIKKEGIVGIKFKEKEDNYLVLFYSNGNRHITIEKKGKIVVDKDLTQKVIPPPLFLSSKDKEKQLEIVNKFRSSIPSVILPTYSEVSNKGGEEFEFFGIKWVNLGESKITKTSDGMLNVLTQKESDKVSGIRTKLPLDFPIRIEIKGKLRSYNDRISFGLCDENGVNGVAIFAGGETGTRVYWTTKRTAPQTGWTDYNTTYVSEPMFLNTFYYLQCNLGPIKKDVPFKGIIMNEEREIIGNDWETDPLPYSHPDAKYLYIGHTDSNMMNQTGEVKINPVK